MNDRDRILRKARKTNNAADWESYRKLRNKCNIMMRKSKATCTKNLLNKNARNPKSFWKTVKDIFPTKSSSKNKITDNDEQRNKTKAESFKQYFSCVVSNLKEATFLLKDCIWKTTPTTTMRTTKSFKFEYVSIVFIKNFVKSLKKNKATGVDNLPAQMLKDCADSIAKPLQHIVNLSLQTGTVPTEWKTAKIVPIYKSGNMSKVENYRPISVLPVLSKVLEKAVHNQLSTYLEQNELLNKFQFGYRSKRSTDIATTLFVDEIRENGDKGKLTGALFLDLSKAFDTINHSLILNKLESYGINRKEIQWFTDYLFCRKQTVVIGNQRSKPFHLSSGVPQGSILGPLIFLIFFNDFPESMLFGTSKRRSKKKTIQLKLNEEPINHTESYCYLGNHLDPSLTLNENFERSYKKANGRLNLLQKMRQYLNTDAAFKIFEMVIVPLLLYSTFIQLQLTNTQQKKFDSIERKAKKVIGGNKNIAGLESRRMKKACKMVRKCLNGDTCCNFNDYFLFNTHEMNTRNKNSLLKLPKINLEFGRKTFKFQGAKLFNDLPSVIRNSKTTYDILLDKHFI